MLNANAPEWHPTVVESPPMASPSAPAAPDGGTGRGQQQCQSRREKRRGPARTSSGSAPLQSLRHRGGNQQPTNPGFEIYNKSPKADMKSERRARRKDREKELAAARSAEEDVKEVRALEEMWPALEPAKWDAVPVSKTVPAAAEIVEMQEDHDGDGDADAVFYVSSAGLVGADTSSLLAHVAMFESVSVKWLDKYSVLMLIRGVSLREAREVLGARQPSGADAQLGLVALPDLRLALGAPGRAPVLDVRGRPCTLQRVPLAGELSFLLDQIALAPPLQPPLTPPRPGSSLLSSAPPLPSPLSPARAQPPSPPASAAGGTPCAGTACGGEGGEGGGEGESLLVQLALSVPHMVGALWPPRRLVPALRTCRTLRTCLLAHARAAAVACSPGAAAESDRGGRSEGERKRQGRGEGGGEEGEGEEEGGGGRGAGRGGVPTAEQVREWVGRLSCPGVRVAVRSRGSHAASRRVLRGLRQAIAEGWEGVVGGLDLSYSQCDLSGEGGEGGGGELEDLVGILRTQGRRGLAKVKLRENWGGAAGAGALGAALAECPGLVELDLGYNRLGEGTGEVVAGLGRCAGLESMLLGGNQMGDRGSRELAGAMWQWEGLRRLDVSGNGLGGAGAEALTKALRGCTRLQVLAMGGNKLMGGEGAMWLATAVERLEELEELDLGGNLMSEEGMRAIAGALQGRKRLERLELGGNAIGAGGARELREVLEACGPRLTRLGLRANHIGGGDGARQLARGLAECRSLTSLDLGSNGFGPRMAAGVVGALREHSSQLQELGLRHNALGRQGVQVWRSVLTHFTAITDLDLSYNELRGEGAGVVMEGLKSCRGLKRLDLERNLIGGREAVKLAGLLVPLQEMEWLNLQGNLLREDGGARLDNGIWGCGGMRPVRAGDRQDVLEQLKATLPACRVTI